MLLPSPPLRLRTRARWLRGTAAPRALKLSLRSAGLSICGSFQHCGARPLCFLVRRVFAQLLALWVSGVRLQLEQAAGERPDERYDT